MIIDQSVISTSDVIITPGQSEPAPGWHQADTGHMMAADPDLDSLLVDLEQRVSTGDHNIYTDQDTSVTVIETRRHYTTTSTTTSSQHHLTPRLLSTTMSQQLQHHQLINHSHASMEITRFTSMNFRSRSSWENEECTIFFISDSSKWGVTL